MPTKIYDIRKVTLLDGTELEIIPLKIKYLRQFMDKFNTIQNAQTDNDSIFVLVECVHIAMQQFYPVIKAIEDVEDNFDLPTIYQVIEYCAGIKIGAPEEDVEVKQQVNKNNDNSWDKLDLAKLESELFMLGIWKNFDELESNISMAELMIILESRRDLDYNEKKFMAAMQGVDLDAQQPKDDPWEAMKARVAAKVSGIGNGDPNDVLSLQGQRAAQAGFGIGMGLDYETVSG